MVYFPFRILLSRRNTMLLYKPVERGYSSLSCEQLPHYNPVIQSEGLIPVEVSNTVIEYDAIKLGRIHLNG